MHGIKKIIVQYQTWNFTLNHFFNNNTQKTESNNNIILKTTTTIDNNGPHKLSEIIQESFKNALAKK